MAIQQAYIEKNCAKNVSIVLKILLLKILLNLFRTYMIKLNFANEQCILFIP